MGRYDFGLSCHKLKFLHGKEACPRCFYDHCALKLERPRGIMASLPNGMDGVMKAYADQFRGSLPPFLAGLVPGKLWEGSHGKTYQQIRHWQSNFKPNVPTPSGMVGLINGLDDLLDRGEDGVSILDWKTKGSKPEPGYAAFYYQIQADIYHVHLKQSGLKVHPEAFFVFAYPREIDLANTAPDFLSFTFDVDVQVLTSSYERGLDALHDAASILKGGDRPHPGPNCDHCRWAAEYAAIGEPTAHTINL